LAQLDDVHSILRLSYETLKGLISLASRGVAKLTDSETRLAYTTLMTEDAERGEGNPSGRVRVAYCSCGRTFKIPEEDWGNRLHCIYCNATLRFLSDGNPEIRVQGVDAAEVESVSQSLFAKAPQTRTAQKQFPLVSAMFFLIMFVVVFGAILTAARLLPIYVFPLVLIGGILTFSVVGAFILREDLSLSEKSFRDLMRLSFRYLPLLRKRER
jgi:hypothetical protein